MKIRLLSVITLLLAVSAFAQQTAAVAPVDPLLAHPTFEQNVFAIAPNGDWGAVAAVYSDRWYASADTAGALGRKFDAQVAAEPTSPQTGGALVRWKIVQVPDGPMLDKIRYLSWRAGYVREQDLQPYMALPVHGMQVLTFPGSCKINAGYLAGYYARNSPLLFPGLAEKYVRANIQAECGGGASFAAVLSAPVRLAARGVARLAGKHKYPAVLAKHPKLRKR